MCLRRSNWRLCFLSILLLLGFGIQGAFADTFFVHPDLGNDLSSGSRWDPFRTLKRAMDELAPGDTLSLFPVVYSESIEFYSNRSGAPGSPIVVEGNGAIINGKTPLNTDEWVKVGEGLYKNITLARMKRFDIIRWGFFFDEKLERMGRTSKGAKLPFKAKEDLGYNEWTFDDSLKAFYIQIPPSAELRDCNIKFPGLINGVGIGSSHHLVIKDVTVVGVMNDGFNIHGDCVGLYFENIVAKDCGDDGLSAHEASVIRVSGFTSINNSTGVCNVNSSRAEISDLLIRDCVGHDLLFPQGGINRIKNCVIISEAQHMISVGARKDLGLSASLFIENMVVIRRDGTGLMKVSEGGFMEVAHCTAIGASIENHGTFRLFNSSIRGFELKIMTEEDGWFADNNLYDVSRIQVGDDTYVSAEFKRYQTETGQDQASLWVTVPMRGDASPTVGADFNSLPEF